MLPHLSQAIASPSAAMFLLPHYTTPQQPPPPYTSAPSLNGILTPGMVPDSVPREVRYEIIGGKLKAVEHFKAEDIGIGQGGKRGYNNYHGWDKGASPCEPGLKSSTTETKRRGGNGGKAGKGSGKTPGKASSASQKSERPKKSLAPSG